jgi:hypothetical protein
MDSVVKGKKKKCYQNGRNRIYRKEQNNDKKMN